MLTNQTTYRVIYGDTDNMGMAYHANYLRWFEMGRAELFRAAGLSYKEIEENGIFLPVSQAHLKYLAPARYDDVIVIEATVDGKIKAGVKFEYRIFSQEEKLDLATGYTIHAFVNGDGRVIRPPAFIKALIDKHFRNKPTLAGDD
jgi:acyl-CoA thioester hydrolase